MKREADFSVLFRHYLRAYPLPYSCAFEMKQTTSNSIPFSAVESHQIEYGMALKSKNGTLVRVQGSAGEPDYFYGYNMPSYIVIKYPDQFSIIDVETFLLESKRSKRRSLTAERAEEIAVRTVVLTRTQKRSGRSVRVRKDFLP